MNMNSLIFLRNSSKRLTTLASYNSLKLVFLPSFSSPSPINCNESPNVVAGGRFLKRDFHGSRWVDFKASGAACYGLAAAQVSCEDHHSSPDHGLEISNLGISQELVTALAKKGITKLFPIQKAVLEPATSGRDMIGRARTGTGKTLAFGIPVMDKIIRYNEKHGRGRNPLAIILAPTRELARQVDKEFYESAPNLDTLCAYGGAPIQRQMSTLDRGVDIIVGTPGRVIDLLKRGALNLSEVQFAVLDEADQMLAVGFQEEVETILEYLPRERQTMMFSATMPSWIQKITNKYLKNPLTIDLVGDSDQKLADGITLYSIEAELYDKASIIGPLITEHANGGKSIVFTGTKRDADRLAKAVRRNFRCESMHGDISQNQRERTLAGFRDGHINVLVATDVAARGLDVPNVDLVIHYDLPNSSEIFVHRSGRTGRAGKKGTAILIHSSQQRRDVKGYERDVGCRFSELPQIAVGAGSRIEIDGGFGSSGGRFGNSRSGGYGGSGFGSNEGGFGGSSYGRSGGGYTEHGGSGGFGGGDSGGFGKAGGSSGFGNSSGGGRTSGFGDFSSGRPSSGFGDFSSGRSSGSGNSSGAGRRSGFGGFSSGGSSGSSNWSGQSSKNRYNSFGSS